MRASSWNINYAARDLVTLGTLGVLAGVVNTGLHQVWMAALPAQWTLNSALVQGAYAWAYFLAFYLVRKPGSFLAVGVLETAVQILLGNVHGAETLGWGLIQALAAELVMALTGYRVVNLLTFMLAGAAAAQAHTLWTMRVFANSTAADVVRQYWTMTPAVWLSGAILSGVLGFWAGRLLARSGLFATVPTKSGG